VTATAVKPPLCNTGASHLTWDWYQATFNGSTDALSSANAVMRVIGAAVEGGGQWSAAPGLYGYSRAMVLGGVPVGSVKVLYGSSSGEIHVQATGSVADVVAPVLRQWWPNHRVSRADVALDVDESGSFERLYKGVHALARVNPRGRVSTSTAGDWIDCENGRTFYAGGTKSRLRVRVYEKGHEQRGKDPDCGASLDWTRVEWQLRPTSDQKGWLARASKVEALGLSSFGAAVAAEVMGSDVLAVGNLLRFASQDPLYWMVRNNRRAVLGLVELDPDDIRLRLVELLDAIGTPRGGEPDGEG